MRPRIAVIIVGLGMCWSLSGCSSDSRPTTSSTVKGVVIVNGEDLIEGGNVNFVAPGTGNAAIGMVGPDGTFVVPGGMVPGEYKVTITPQSPTPEYPEPKESRVPEKYRKLETSDLTATISSGKNELKFELRS